MVFEIKIRCLSWLQLLPVLRKCDLDSKTQVPATWYWQKWVETWRYESVSFSLFLQSILKKPLFVYTYIHTLCMLYYVYVYYIYINYICFLSPHVLQLSISNSLHFANVSFSKQTNPPVVSVRRASSRHQLGRTSNFGRNLAPTWRFSVCRNLGKPGAKMSQLVECFGFIAEIRDTDTHFSIESQVDRIPQKNKSVLKLTSYPMSLRRYQ